MSSVIVDFPSPMELVMMPLPFIRGASVIVEQPAVAVHRVIFPLALIVPSVFVVEGSFSVSLVIIYESTIFASILVLQFPILSFRFVR